MSFFSDEESTEEAKTGESTSKGELMGAATATAIQAGMGLMPTVTKALGVTDKQAKGGLGAIFMAAQATLTPEDFKLISNAVPGIDGYIASAPAVNGLVGGAMGMFNGSTAMANLASQFNDLGLGADMIAKFSQQAVNYIEASSSETASTLSGALSDFL